MNASKPRAQPPLPIHPIPSLAHRREPTNKSGATCAECGDPLLGEDCDDLCSSCEDEATRNHIHFLADWLE